MEEESFPRGGSVKRQKGPVKQDREDKDLFKTAEGDKSESRAKRTREKRKKKGDANEKKVKKPKLQGTLQMQSPGDHYEPLAYKMITAGMKILGCVKEIHEFELVLSLPNGCTGTVPITGISDTYRDLLMKMAENTEPESQDELNVHTLTELFKIGMMMPCKVMDIKNNKKGKKNLILSVNPREINQDINAADIRNGLVLYGSVMSQEDHGYIVDIGVKGIKAFLNNQSAERFIQLYNDGYPLMIGQPVMCKLQTGSDRLERLVGETRVANITIDPNKVGQAQIKESMELKFSCFQPGMKVTCFVAKTSEQGIKVKFLSSYTGTILSSHLTCKPDKYDKQQKLEASILYIHPTTKLVSLSALPHIVNYNGVPVSNQFGDLSVGVVIDTAEVLRVDDKRGVFLKLADKITALAGLKYLSDKEMNDVKLTFKRGSKHKCRVLDFDYNDNLVLVTMKESIINQQYLKFTDINPGDVVECTVSKILATGLVVKVTNEIRGFISMLHLADIPLKHPEKKFDVGKKLKCRVLSVNPDKKKLDLTNKKSLVQSKLPILTSFNQLQRGVIVEGFIGTISNNGLLVVFYNEMKGWVPNSELSTEPIPYPEKVFYKGQVVKCQVLKWEENRKRLILSLKIGSMVPFGVSSVSSDYKVGKIVDCKVKSKTEKGIDIELIPSNMAAYLPKMHLSDSVEICDMLLDTYKEGAIIKDVMYINKSKIPVMTKRLSMIEVARENELISDFDQIQPGMMVPGSVKNLMDYGIFVEFPGGLFGLAPNKYATDVKVPDLKELYRPGQSVLAKVIEVDKEKKRCLISLRMTDCYHGDTDIGVGILEDNLKQMDYVFENMAKRKGIKQKLSQMEVGNICKSKVTEVNTNGALCLLDNGLKGFVTKSHMEGLDVTVGQKLESVILYIDPKNDCLELSFDKTLIKTIKHRKDNKASMVKEGQVLKSEILLVKEHLVLVVLKGHGAGKLAYIPSKRHLNDVLEMHQYFEKQVNEVAIKHQCGNHQLACLQIHEDRKQKEIELEQAAERKLASKENHNFKCGMTVKAVVRHVYPHQINVSLNGFPGRIHVTEIVDNIKNGKKPCQSYKASMEIDVRIIGFRDAKSHSLLPISHPGVTRSLPECTVKPSKMSLIEIGEEDQVFHPGDKILAFVHNYQNNCLWMHVTPSVSGRVYFLNLSNNLRAIENPSHFFKPGQGYHATVLNVEENGSLELSLIDEKEMVRKNGITKGLITSISQESGLTIQLVEGYKGVVGLTDISDSYTDNPASRYHKGQCVRCYVLSVDSDNKEQCALSLRKSRLTTDCNIKDPDIQSMADLTEGQILRGFVTKRVKSGLTVSIGKNISGKVNTDNIPPHHNVSPVYRAYPLGKVVFVKILSLQKTDISLAILKENDFEPLIKVPNKILEKNRKRSVSDSSVDDTGVSAKKKKRKSADKKTDVVSMATSNSDTDSGVEVREDADSDMESRVITSTTEVPRLEISTGFTWDTDFQMPADDDVSHHDNTISDDSEDDGGENNAKKKSGKKRKKLEEEKKLFELEKLRLEGDSLPETSEDFDRLVLQSPDSSIVWLRYMAYHLEMAEIEKARVVAERALKTISYREEQEKLNVWVAYLNLENMYGSQESLKAVLDRAIQQNEPIKVYNQMINIYVASGKIQEAEQLYNIMVRKYSMYKDAWTGFGLFYFKNNRIESARNLLQRSLKSLNKKDHVEVIAKFAQMEYKHGEPERGKTMFENILSNYPKRSDLWSVYIDMSTKAGDTDSTRQLYERIINLKMSAKKMKFFFKKYLDFEKAHGNTEQVENVMQKAMEYVDSRGYVDE